MRICKHANIHICMHITYIIYKCHQNESNLHIANFSRKSTKINIILPHLYLIKNLSNFCIHTAKKWYFEVGFAGPDACFLMEAFFQAIHKGKELEQSLVLDTICHHC